MLLRTQASIDSAGDVGGLPDGAAFEEQGRAQGQASDAGVVRVGAQQCIEALLVGAQKLEEGGQAQLGEVECLLAQTLLGHGEGAREQRNGLIEAVGPAAQVAVPAGYELVDCGDAVIVPGIVEMHCHIASESFDLNDTVHPTNPEFRTLDLISMEHDQLRAARAGGISTALYIPGSGSNMGGFGTLTKTWGRTPEEALVRFPGSL